MANTLGVYNPLFYANEALIHLEKALGMAGRVHRGFDAERRTFGKGEFINIRKPSTFTAQDAPSTAVDLDTETVQMQLNQWKEVKFKLTDKELAYTTTKIIDDHISPAAYALAENLDSALCNLYKDVPWHYDLNGTPGSVVTDITKVHQVLFDNSVPMQPGRIHYMVDGTLQAGLLANAAFTQWQGAGMEGVRQQMAGTLGERFGMELFANQNVKTHTKGALADPAGAMAADFAKGVSTITIDDLTDGQTVVIGDSFVIAGNTQRYVFTAAGTVASNALTSITISPALAAAAAEDAVVTISSDTHVANLAFHRNAFALAMAPLSEMGNELGAKVATVTDTTSGLSIRSRIYYVGNSSEVHVALDILYGVETLDGNLATRARG